ncbi:MAG: hypothetical protein QNJ60_06695 [Xenococcaceae cyanobacterium MO_188.B19]|nr:hypothetical protein [Xenococcaceae cyanobacterium MO_188.B19]
MLALSQPKQPFGKRIFFNQSTSAQNQLSAKAHLSIILNSTISIKDKPGTLLMPIDNRKYPDNWKEIALSVKESANWRCSCCGKPCYKPGEIPEHLTRSEWTANILQVHHRNHDPSWNESENLQCGCGRWV